MSELKEVLDEITRMTPEQLIVMKEAAYEDAKKNFSGENYLGQISRLICK